MLTGSFRSGRALRAEIDDRHRVSARVDDALAAVQNFKPLRDVTFFREMEADGIPSRRAIGGDQLDDAAEVVPIGAVSDGLAGTRLGFGRQHRPRKSNAPPRAEFPRPQ